jgi:hypothetical protein
MTGLALIGLTGSRNWTDVQLLEDTLTEAWHDALANGHTGIELMHGCADGADTIGHEWAWRTGFLIREFPADWAGPCGPDCRPGHRRRNRRGAEYCPHAGHRRNQQMVDQPTRRAPPAARPDVERPRRAHRHPTISRMADGKRPDADGLVTILVWLDLTDIVHFIKPKETDQPPPALPIEGKNAENSTTSQPASATSKAPASRPSATSSTSGRRRKARPCTNCGFRCSGRPSCTRKTSTGSARRATGPSPASPTPITGRTDPGEHTGGSGAPWW